MSLTYGFCLDADTTMYNSAQFSDAFHAVAGDGVTLQGTQLEATINGFAVTVGSGYALSAGRWLENDEPLTIPIGPSSNNDDRTDALVVRVDYTTRKASLEVLVNVDVLKLPGELRNTAEYSIILYLIHIRRGATTLTPEDVVDLRSDSDMCGDVLPLSAIAGDVLYIYQFLTSGIDQEVARILGLSQALVAKGNAAIARLDKEIEVLGGKPEIGELLTARNNPTPEAEWLLCNGAAVPAGYPALSALLGGTLPEISTAADRYKTYIYAGVA